MMKFAEYLRESTTTYDRPPSWEPLPRNEVLKKLTDAKRGRRQVTVYMTDPQTFTSPIGAANNQRQSSGHYSDTGYVMAVAVSGDAFDICDDPNGNSPRRVYDTDHVVRVL